MTSYTKTGLQNDISDCLPSCEKCVINPSKGVFNVLKMWLETSRQRKLLAKLNERQLTDIGLTRFEADQEIAKPFWRC